MIRLKRSHTNHPTIGNGIPGIVYTIETRSNFVDSSILLIRFLSLVPSLEIMYEKILSRSDSFPPCHSFFFCIFTMY